MLSSVLKRRCFSTCSVLNAKKASKKNIKKNEVAEKVILGRPSNNLSVGVVGLPNIG
jgi:obg-like ATPase 1